MNSYKSLFSNKNLHIIYDFSNKNNKNNFKPSSKYNKNDIIINSHCFKSMASYLFLNYKNDDEFFLDEYDNNSLTISEIIKYESFSEKINLYKDMIFFTKLLNQHKKILLLYLI